MFHSISWHDYWQQMRMLVGEEIARQRSEIVNAATQFETPT